MRGLGRLSARLGLVGLALLAAPASAGAAPTCVYNALGSQLLVELNNNGDEAQIERVGDDIKVFEGSTEVVCDFGPATVFTTDTVIVSQTGPKRGELVINHLNQENRFSPGASTAGNDAAMGATREIEFVANLGPGRDRLNIINSVDLVAGDSGVNPNATSSEVAPDADVAYTGIDRFSVDGAGGDDLVDLSGGACCGGPIAVPAIANGGIDDDIVIAGSANDRLIGDFGLDQLYGGRGDDRIDAGPDADVVLGGRGFDTVIYGLRAAGVTVTLGSGTQDDGGDEDGPAGARDTIGRSTEGVVGTDEDDELRGNGRGNFLRGGPGVDSLFGLGGDDGLHARDGERDDTIDCGPGNGDSALFDPPPQPTDPPPQSC